MTFRPTERVNSMDCSKLRYDTLFHAILVACGGDKCAVSSFRSWMRRHIQTAYLFVQRIDDLPDLSECRNSSFVRFLRVSTSIRTP